MSMLVVLSEKQLFITGPDTNRNLSAVVLKLVVEAVGEFSMLYWVGKTLLHTAQSSPTTRIGLSSY